MTRDKIPITAINPSGAMYEVAVVSDFPPSSSPPKEYPGGGPDSLWMSSNKVKLSTFHRLEFEKISI